MLHTSISELTTLRWDLATEVEGLARHGFRSVSIWRTKLSDLSLDEARETLERAGMRVSSLQWAGGFTGGDGKTFRESLDDALEAIDTAAEVGANILTLHSGCRGGHTLKHARRLLTDACDVLAPVALGRGVTLAFKPMHPAAAGGCGFITCLQGACEWVERFDHPALRIALDLWHFGHDPRLLSLLHGRIPLLAVVQVADSLGLPSNDRERLPPGQGNLPLDALICGLVARGYTGDFEFEAVGETVESLGYDHVLRQARLTADAWTRRLRMPAPEPAELAVGSLLQ